MFVLGFVDEITAREAPSPPISSASYGDEARSLIMVCIEHGLFPYYYPSRLSTLSNLFGGGVPAKRND
ncbi:hypothetical protein B7L09_07505 [Pseudomonas mandelii]|nr:hypothetical protein B7L09_07505 [Pseudomonas mandelii]